MSAKAAAYPKLFNIYKELKRPNEIIFEAEKERNAWELERDDLKGLAPFYGLIYSWGCHTLDFSIISATAPIFV